MEMVGSVKFRLMGCGIPSKDADNTELRFDGWFTTFYPYDAFGERISGPMTYNARLLPEVVETPFIYEIRDYDGTVLAKYDMLLYAGIIGLSEDASTGALKPEIGWMIRCILPDEERDFFYENIKTDIPNVFASPLHNEDSVVNRLIGSSSRVKDKTKEVSNPLVVVDGNITDVDGKKLSDMIADNDITRQEAADLLGLATGQIKNVSILTTPASTAIWGMRGRNGVLDIQTTQFDDKPRRRLFGRRR